MNKMAEGLGRAVRRFLNKVVGYVLFIWELFKNIPGAFTNLHTTVEQMHHVGITSIPVVFAASLATGAIMSWQLAYQFGDMIPMMFVGMAVGKSVMVELCPILTLRRWCLQGVSALRCVRNLVQWRLQSSLMHTKY